VTIVVFMMAVAGFANAQLYSEKVVADNPLVYWRFSNDLTDSMNNVDLDPAVSPAFVESPLPGGKAYSSSGGKAWAAAFGAVDVLGLYDFTYELWINLSGENDGNYVLQRYGGGSNVPGENSLVYQDGGIGFLRTGPGELLDTPYVELPDNTDEWHHFVITNKYDDARITIYLDGEVAFEGEALLEPFIGGNDYEVYIGAQRQNPGETVFNGSMDEVAIYDIALTADQVTSHYEAKTSADAYAEAVLGDTPLVYWRFEENYEDEMDRYGLQPSGVQFVEGPGGTPNTALMGRVTSTQAEILYDGIEAFTYELWFNPIFRSAQSYIFFRRVAGGQNAVIYAYNPNQLEFFHLSDGSRPSVEIPNETDRWYYCVVLNDPSVPQFRIYIDGELAVDVEGFAGPGSQNIVVVGGSDKGDNFNGYIDEVAMYDYVLTEDQIQDHFTAEMNPAAVDSWELH